MSTTQAPEGSHRATPAGFAHEDWTRRVLRHALEAIEAGASASIVMNVEGLKDNIRALLAAPAPSEGDALVTARSATLALNHLACNGKYHPGVLADATAMLVRAELKANPKPKGMRQSFEAWYSRRYGYDFGQATQDTWKHAAMCDAWEVWQAAAQAPAPVDEPAVPCTWKKPGESDDAWLDRITGATPARAVGAEAGGLSPEVESTLREALVALSFCGKSTQARALNAQATRRIKQVLGQP